MPSHNPQWIETTVDAVLVMELRKLRDYLRDNWDGDLDPDETMIDTVIRLLDFFKKQKQCYCRELKDGALQDRSGKSPKSP